MSDYYTPSGSRKSKKDKKKKRQYRVYKRGGHERTENQLLLLL